MSKQLGNIGHYDLRYSSICELHERIRRDFCGCQLRPRQKFTLLPEYVRWLKDGRKCTTVRFRAGAIDVPSAARLPLVESGTDEDNHSPLSGHNHQLGTVAITRILIKPFALLDEQDALRDGFSSRAELRRQLQSLYGTIDDEQYVSIYSIQLSECEE